MNEPPDHTAVLSAANLLSFFGMTVPKYCFTSSGCSRSAVSMSREDDALGLEVLAVAVVDDLGLVLGGDAGEVLALGLGDAELLVGVLHRVGQLVPGVDLMVGRLDVVVDVVEEDLRHVAAPVGHGAPLEVLEGLEPVVCSIQSGSPFIHDISLTMSVSSPRLGLKT